MSEIIKPAIGSNQHITKFGEARKKSFRLSKRTKVELVGIAIIAILATVNYYVIKANYVVTCAIKVGELTQSTAGHFMSKNTCNDIASDWMSARNYELDQYAKKQLINN